MAKRMLIDSTHAEETRVVVVNGTRLEEFDVETSTKKQLKGNIYLAKIVRVEPSLQAAFVEYGGNRHGFLAFSEIHPDYYQIPVADRQALIAEQREVMKQSSTAASADFGDNDADDDVHNGEEAHQPQEQPTEAGNGAAYVEGGEASPEIILPGEVGGEQAQLSGEHHGEAADEHHAHLSSDHHDHVASDHHDHVASDHHVEHGEDAEEGEAAVPSRCAITRSRKSSSAARSCWCRW